MFYFNKSLSCKHLSDTNQNMASNLLHRRHGRQWTLLCQHHDHGIHLSGISIMFRSFNLCASVHFLLNPNKSFKRSTEQWTRNESRILNLNIEMICTLFSLISFCLVRSVWFFRFNSFECVWALLIEQRVENVWH